jgi:hypothetical protein
LADGESRAQHCRELLIWTAPGQALPLQNYRLVPLPLAPPGSIVMLIQRIAPTTAIMAAKPRAVSHPNCAASHGMRTGEIRPPRLLPKFMTPPPIPLCRPQSWVMEAQ